MSIIIMVKHVKLTVGTGTVVEMVCRRLPNLVPVDSLAEFLKIKIKSSDHA